MPVSNTLGRTNMIFVIGKFPKEKKLAYSPLDGLLKVNWYESVFSYRIFLIFYSFTIYFSIYNGKFVMKNKLCIYLSISFSI